MNHVLGVLLVLLLYKVIVHCDIRCNEKGCVRCNDLKSGSCLECIPDAFLSNGACVSYVWIIIPLLIAIFVVIMLLVKYCKKDWIEEVRPSSEGTGDANVINSHNLSFEQNNFEFTVIEDNNPNTHNPQEAQTAIVTHELKQPHLQNNQNQENFEANQFNMYF